MDHSPHMATTPWSLPGSNHDNRTTLLPVIATTSGELYQVRDNSAASSDNDDHSGSEEGNDAHSSLENLESSIFEGYMGMQFEGKSEDGFALPGLSKIRNLLVASRIGAMSCLICLEKVRISDPIWDCKAGCHAVYHLICIQAWAREASSAAAERSRTRLPQEHFPAAAALAAAWHCPKCRTDYTRDQIPRDSRCFCGKVVDPPIDPWLTAHSCGQICGRFLKEGCGHDCKLLCHPGPCPPCPQFVKADCFCGAQTDMRRCGHKHFSCGKVCGKDLTCRIHKCQNGCHAGTCPPCTKSSLHSCRCGRVEEVRACAESDFLCHQICGKLLQCKKHWCKKVCHSGPCGDCEFQGRQRCPCGKVEYKGMECDLLAPTCGSTCEKLLQCSLHRCQERCHTGSCNNVCRVVTLKICRCGSFRKEVPCHQDLQCERKCQRLRDCKRHPCKRRCCSGECPPCSEVCGRKLRCGNHKCPALCHRGPCAPCPVSVRISCACNSTAYEVPCGAERERRPPPCPKLCSIVPRCRHGLNCKPHRCHYGACPPCQLVCGEELPCGHTCKQRCHGPQPPPNPEFNLKLKKKRKVSDQDGHILGSPCPPCSEHVLRQCLGRHLGGEKTMICSESFPFGCGRLCGNLLACNNHVCQKPCHEVTVPQQDQAEATRGSEDVASTCMQCTLTCQKKRVLACPHPCTQPCHPGDCSPCKALIKRSCYCGALVHVFECSVFNRLPEDERKMKLSCGGPCHRKLPNCSHLCPEICHPGPCVMALNCRKKVFVRCQCQRLKKEWVCFDVQAAYSNGKVERPRGLVGVGLLACDEQCRALSQERKWKEDIDELHQRKSTIIEDPLTTKTFKRRRRYNSVDSKEKNSKFKEVSYKLFRWILMGILLLALVIGVYFGARGLQALSDWMNELDAKRPPKRLGGNFIM